MIRLRLKRICDMPFRCKLTCAIAGVCAIALLLACAAFVAYDLVQCRRAIPAELRVISQVIAENARAPLAFKNRRFAQSTVLPSLAAHPYVSTAVVYDRFGNVFAAYTRPGSKRPPPAVTGSGASGDRAVLRVEQQITDDSQLLGTIIVESDMHELYARAWAYCGIAVLVLVLTLGGAVILAVRVERVISRPVLELAKTARTVADQKDYSLRARSFNEDELGALTADFNQMLEQIQRQNDQLKQSRERYEVAALGSRDGIWDWDITTDTVYLSARWKEMLGYSDEEMPTTAGQWKDRLHPEDKERALEALTEYLAGKRPVYEIEFRMRHRDGSYRWILARGAAIRDSSGRATRMAGSHTDITDQHSMQTQLRQAQKMEAVGQLAAGVAHDFNNILTVIQGHAGLQLEIGEVSANTADSLKQISEAAVRAANLTRQLLAFSRKQIIRLEALDLNTTLGSVGKLLQRLIGEQVSLQMRCKPGLPPVLADACSLEQIVINLAVNARDAMANGGVLTICGEVSVIAGADRARNPEARCGEFMCLSVTDTGCGMDETVRSRIFEPFFTTKDVGKGTGMGLATVHGIVKQHQGWIEVESEVGQGTTFKVFLPLATTAASSQPAAEAAAENVRLNATVLVAEDQPEVSRLMCEILTRAGCRVFPACNGAEAFAIWREQKAEVDVLLTDMVMPGEMKGCDLAARLFAEKPDLKVIYTSGYSLDLAGMNLHPNTGAEYLAKPFKRNALLQAVQRVLARAGVQPEPGAIARAA